MKLYLNRASPFARKARVVAREAGITNQIEEIETTVSPVAENESLAQNNPLVKIPALAAVLETEAATWGDEFNIGHIGAACVCGYLDFRFADWNWRSGHPQLAAWFERVARRPSVAETAPPA